MDMPFTAQQIEWLRGASDASIIGYETHHSLDYHKGFLFGKAVADANHLSGTTGAIGIHNRLQNLENKLTMLPYELKGQIVIEIEDIKRQVAEMGELSNLLNPKYGLV